jgi:hypothetical protein
VLYVSAASPLGVGLAALVGSFDPDHHALVQTELGSTRLVLHHERKCAGHHHGLVARALTAFAEPVRADQPDHVLQFRVADSFSHQRQLIAPSPAQLDQPALAVTATPVWSARANFLSAGSTHPPPAARGQLLCLRATVLMI